MTGPVFFISKVRNRRFIPENNKASNCSSGLLYFCLLCSNLRHFRTTHCFTVKWKSALDFTFLAQLPEKRLFFAVVNGFCFFRIIKQQLVDRFWDLLADFLTSVSNSIICFKKILSLLYFLLTLYSIFTQLVRKFDLICLLRTLLYSILRLSIFTHTLGKIHFLLCFACFINLCSYVRTSTRNR